MVEFWLTWWRSNDLSEKKLKIQFGVGDVQALELSVWEEKLPLNSLALLGWISYFNIRILPVLHNVDTIRIWHLKLVGKLQRSSPLKIP